MSKSRKGKTYEEIYGEERAREIRRKQHIANRGSNNGMFGKHHSLETRRKIREKALGRLSEKKGKSHEEIYGIEHSQGIREKLSIANVGKKRSLKSRLKQSNSIKGPKNPFYGKHHTQKALRKNADAHRGDKCSMRRPEVARKQGNSLRKRWSDPEYKRQTVKAILKGLGKTPNKAEAKLEDLLDQHNLPFRFVGDGQLIIGGMCPDYANYNGAKQLIELYGDYWHKGDNPQVRIDAFKKYGYDCLVIWEHELRDESEILNRVRSSFKLE